MAPRISPKALEYVVGAAISLAAFAVYLRTMCPTVDFIDAGELATVTITLGIAHPTGYPLFTLIGWLFAHLPLGLRPIRQLNLMAAVFCALALFVFFRFLVFFLREHLVKRGPGAGRINLQILAPAAAGTLALAFSETFWSQAVAIEVYPLHVFLLAVNLFLFTTAIAAEGGNSPGGAGARWLGFAFTLGLSFANHMTTVLLAPAFLFLFFATYGFRRNAWSRIGRMVPPFIAGLSVYCYLPIRAGMHPLLNWGDPETLDRFWRHVVAKQYSVWIFSSAETASRQFSYFLNTILPEFAYVPVIVAVAGLWALAQRRPRKIAVFTLLLFLGCLLYAINYDIHDIDSYFLLAYVTVALWCACGVAWIISRWDAASVGVAAVLIAACSFSVISNYDAADESRSTLVEQYSRDMLASLEPNALVLTYEWDYFVSAAYYLQLVEHVRPDVVIVDKELLRRSWYFGQLRTRYPWLIAQSRPVLDAYLRELDKFEGGLPYDPALIENRYRGLIRSFIDRNYATRPVYATPELEPEYTSGYTRIPSGLAFRLVNDPKEAHTAAKFFSVGFPEKSNAYVDGVRSLYARAYLNTAIYLNSVGRRDSAVAFVDSALAVKPDFREAGLFRSSILGRR